MSDGLYNQCRSCRKRYYKKAKRKLKNIIEITEIEKKSIEENFIMKIMK